MNNNFTQADLYNIKMIIKIAAIYNLADSNIVAQLVEKIEDMEDNDA